MIASGFLAVLALSAAMAGAQDGSNAAPTGTKVCSPPFVAKRRSDSWYTSHDFRAPAGCTLVNDSVNETVSIPIYWVVASTAASNWTDAEAQTLMDNAKTWFGRYCITLELNKVVLKQGESQQLGKKLDDANAKSQDDYEKTVNGAYELLWDKRMWKPRTFLLVMFVDPYSAVKFDNVVVNVSGNFLRIPVILITASDKTSDQIATHELVHGLGKGIGSSAPPGTTAYVDDSGNINNSWTEGGCADEMGNANRTSPTVPMVKAADAPMDWASYYEYWKLAKNIH